MRQVRETFLKLQQFCFYFKNMIKKDLSFKDKIDFSLSSERLLMKSFIYFFTRNSSTNWTRAQARPMLPIPLRNQCSLPRRKQIRHLRMYTRIPWQSIRRMSSRMCRQLRLSNEQSVHSKPLPRSMPGHLWRRGSMLNFQSHPDLLVSTRHHWRCLPSMYTRWGTCSTTRLRRSMLSIAMRLEHRMPSHQWQRCMRMHSRLLRQSIRSRLPSGVYH